MLILIYKHERKKSFWYINKLYAGNCHTCAVGLPGKEKSICPLLGFKSGSNSEHFAYWLYIYTSINSLSIQLDLLALNIIEERSQLEKSGLWEAIPGVQCQWVWGDQRPEVWRVCWLLHRQHQQWVRVEYLCVQNHRRYTQFKY